MSCTVERKSKTVSTVINTALSLHRSSPTQRQTARARSSHSLLCSLSHLSFSRLVPPTRHGCRHTNHNRRIERPEHHILKGSVFLAHRPYRSMLPCGRSKPPSRYPSTTRTHTSCWRPVAVQLAGLGHLSHAGAAILDDTSPEPVRSNENDFRGHA